MQWLPSERYSIPWKKNQGPAKAGPWHFNSTYILRFAKAPECSGVVIPAFHGQVEDEWFFLFIGESRTFIDDQSKIADFRSSSPRSPTVLPTVQATTLHTLIASRFSVSYYSDVCTASIGWTAFNAWHSNFVLQVSPFYTIAQWCSPCTDCRSRSWGLWRFYFIVLREFIFYAAHQIWLIFSSLAVDNDQGKTNATTTANRSDMEINEQSSKGAKLWVFIISVFIYLGFYLFGS